jgi:predicted RNase H-like nuclease (RuvC/YqgF family)
MIKSILKLLAILVVGILIYNYFLGTPEEKSTSQKIFKEFKDVGVAVTGLLKSEKEKFDEGKYDQALDKIGQVIDKLKSSAREFDEKYIDRISELDKMRRELSQELDQYRYEEMRKSKEKDKYIPGDSKDSSEIRQSLEEIIKYTETLLKDLESNN